MNVFNTLNLKQTFWNTKTYFFLEYRFLVESATIESATFPYKTVLSKADIKRNWMGRAKCRPIIKNGHLPLTTSFFENLIWGAHYMEDFSPRLKFWWRIRAEISFHDIAEINCFLFLYYMIHFSDQGWNRRPSWFSKAELKLEPDVEKN